MKKSILSATAVLIFYCGVVFSLTISIACGGENSTECEKSSECTTTKGEEKKDSKQVAKETIGVVQEGRPFSPAVRIGDTLYVSGQIAVDPETGDAVRDDIKAETEQVLKNIKRLVEEAGFEMGDVVRATVFLTDISDYGPMNEVYAKFFPENPPARACVAVKELVSDFRVEISCIAQR